MQECMRWDRSQAFFSKRRLNSEILIRALNSVLPKSIRVFEARMINPDFFVLAHTTGKTYEYKIHTGDVLDPLTRYDRMHVPGPLNLTKMRAAAEAMIGKHNFIHFSGLKSVTMRQNRSTIKTITGFNITEIENGVKFSIRGDGFLYHQVRHMVGAVIACGKSSVDVCYLQDLLCCDPVNNENRTPRWKMCDAQGLCLINIEIMELPDPSKLIHPEFEHDEHGRVTSIDK
uniref:tRNA pseudouridine synthase n=1 Tax=Lotharella globosa TaxID=91324 RepID=A0A7S3YAP2_9EUKA|mmetsp:Transcript_2891/g.5513  ORF Transcript_2891/g.5513 Transcript_2891/m.5513 type:complete len:230 (+) Transcript_2891:79-768(+)